jgi:limonene-1,2-epoxide hydrolase
MPSSPLTPDLVLELWACTYNTQGKPDWSHIFPFYHENVTFQDPIQTVVGKEAFMVMCKRLTERCKALEMDISSISADANTIFMEWKMTMIFHKTPSTPLYGCTRLTLDQEGLIISQRDYFDLWNDIFKNVPIMKHIYPRFMRWLFG